MWHYTFDTLYEAIESQEDALGIAYLNGIKQQILINIHDTLDLVEWLYDGRLDALPAGLKVQFDICKDLYEWESRRKLLVTVQK